MIDNIEKEGSLRDLSVGSTYNVMIPKYTLCNISIDWISITDVCIHTEPAKQQGTSDKRIQ